MSKANKRLTVRAELSLLIERAVPILSDLRQLRAWRKNCHSMPAPWRVKMEVLSRYKYPKTAWIETGTFFGKTTRFLARSSPEVISLEPSRTHFLAAKRRLRSLCNVQLLNVTSEEGLEHALGLVKNGTVSLWLDGHYSEGGTFLGTDETPVRSELTIIGEWLRTDPSKKVAVFVDDVRCFTSGGSSAAKPFLTSSYPSRSQLVEWADDLNMSWTIEHDIFIARSEPLSLL